MKIGVTVAESKTQVFLNQAYINYIKDSGYEPVLINKFSNAADMAAYCDGLLLPGGIDLEPTFYGENNVGSMSCDPERDDLERLVLHSFIAAKKKVFGICRGFQLIVREFMTEHQLNGASFYQHINDHSLVNARDAKRSTPTHKVYANMKELYGEGNHQDMFVNSMHHQSLLSKVVINELYDNNNSIKETAITHFGLKKKNEHIVEAVDVVIDGCSLRAVQWHPEELRDHALLRTFFSGKDKVIKHGQH